MSNEKKRIEIFRFNQDKGEWKKFYIERTEGGAFFVMEQGKKGEKGSQSISMKLDFMEISYIRMALEKLLLKSLEI